MDKQTNVSSEKLPAQGLAAFDSLRAENEPWLEHCFVPPPEFDLIAGARSVIVFGEPGSGKTTLYRAIRRHLAAHENRPARLSFEWHPLAGAPPETEVRRLLADGAIELLSYLARWPATFGQAPKHAQATLTWFIHKYLAGALPRTVDELGEQTDATGQSLLRKLAASDVSNKYLDAASSEDVIAELTKSLPRIGLEDVCILVGPDELGNIEAVGDNLSNYLSTLRLLENPCFLYKLILPSTLESTLARTGGVIRRRLGRYRLRWLERNLETIVERRLWLACGGQVEKLTDVCKDKELPVWLARCGGASPRGWLEQSQPLAAHYLDRGQPITTNEWRKIRRIHPPMFWMDEEQRRVTVGYREILDIPDIEWSILRYLYQHRERVCSRDELYHQAHLPISAPRTDQRFYPKEYDGALNNALLRLRQAIEPDPKAPLFIVTHKGRGVRLERVW